MPPTETATLYAGDATVVEDAADRREYRGRVVVLAKPDGTVLVHDADGYQPVAWLTRADAVTVTDDDAFRVTAHDERADDWLRVTGHPDGAADETDASPNRGGFAGQYPVTAAGEPIGRCPACEGALVDTGGAVTCVHCSEHHAYPDDATIRRPTPGSETLPASDAMAADADAGATATTTAAKGDATTEQAPATCDCGLPRMRVERGAVIDCCVDRECERLDEHVRAHLDGEYDCPECEGDLVVERERGLYLACEDRPDCDTAFYVPSGVADGTCECGLPAFALASGRRCLDATCDAD
jgi:DNA topoisomerase-1